MSQEKPGIVFIGEDVEFDDQSPPQLWFTGRFAAHWESEDGQDFRNGPEGVTADEAIAWGREQAEVVQIRVGDGELGGADFGYFSAGRRQPPDDDLPVWPGSMTIPRRLTADPSAGSQG